MDATKLISIALDVLSERLILILALGMVCGMTSWAMWGPQWERLVALLSFPYSRFWFCVEIGA